MKDNNGSAENGVKTDSKTKHGITVGLIDSIITIAAVLAKRGDLYDQDSPAVREAMKDLKSDDNVSWLLTRKTAKRWQDDREAISIAVKGLNAVHPQPANNDYAVKCIEERIKELVKTKPRYSNARINELLNIIELLKK